MFIETKYLGKVEIQQKQIVLFEEGILGFVEYKEYVLLPLGEDSIIYTLQSTQEPNLAFILISPFEIDKNHEVELSEKEISELEIQSAEDVLLFCIVVIPEKIEEMTANFQAPIVLNIRNNKAKQIISSNETHKIKHSIFSILQQRKEGK